MRKLALSFTFLLFCLTKAYGQQFYVTTSNGIQLISIYNGIASSQQVTSCTDGGYGIAMHGNAFYCLEPSGKDFQVYKATVAGNKITNCTLLTTLNLNGPAPNALTVDNNGVLYFAADNTLYKVDPGNPVLVKLGVMPYASGGDLAFYNNDLYMASTTAIIKINLADPSQSSVYINVSNLGSLSLFGLTAVKVNNVIKLYAFAVLPVSTNGQTSILELDMVNQKVVGSAGSLPYAAFDSASPVEGGTTPALQIDTAYINQVCNVTNRGKVQVVAQPDVSTAVLTYTLNGTSNTTGIFQNVPPGSYPVVITSSTGVQKDTVIIVPDYSFNKSKVTVAKTNPVCNVSGKIQFKTINSSLYTIQYNGASYPANKAFLGLTAGNYTFNIINQRGCPVDTVNIALNQEVCYPPVTFPNTFTPNNDGINDIFRPNQDAYAANYTLTVFDRWGAVIFVSTDFHTGWNGQYKGKPVTTGTYYWIATYTDINGTRDTQKGSITLIR